MVPTPEQLAHLVHLAREARETAYAPYSRFAVGAAVLSDDGREFAGANVENASYGLTICAERVAAFRAVGGGARRLVAVAVCADRPVWPCGACLQVLAEFAEGDCVVVSQDPTRIASLAQLLPRGFDAAFLRPASP